MISRFMRPDLNESTLSDLPTLYLWQLSVLQRQPFLEWLEEHRQTLADEYKQALVALPALSAAASSGPSVAAADEEMAAAEDMDEEEAEEMEEAEEGNSAQKTQQSTTTVQLWYTSQLRLQQSLDAHGCMNAYLRYERPRMRTPACHYVAVLPAAPRAHADSPTKTLSTSSVCLTRFFACPFCRSSVGFLCPRHSANRCKFRCCAPR